MQLDMSPERSLRGVCFSSVVAIGAGLPTHMLLCQWQASCRLMFRHFSFCLIMPLELDFDYELQQLQLLADYPMCTERSWDGVSVWSEAIGQFMEGACDSHPGD